MSCSGKIGLSYSRCALDIALGSVRCSDVIFILASTAMTHLNDSTIKMMYYQSCQKLYSNSGYITAYHNTSLFAEFSKVAYDLWNANKIMQSQINRELAPVHVLIGSMALQESIDNIWVDLTLSYNGNNESVQEAYDNYLLLKKLSE